MTDRTAFNSVEGDFALTWFCFTALYDWLAKFAPFSQPVGSQTKTNRGLVASGFFRACRRLHVFASNFDWFIVLFISDMIIHSNYFGSGFGFTTLKTNENPVFIKGWDRDFSQWCGIDSLQLLIKVHFYTYKPLFQVRFFFSFNISRDQYTVFTTHRCRRVLCLSRRNWNSLLRHDPRHDTTKWNSDV